MEQNITISVVVPVYGVEKFIERFALSLFTQSYQSLQFIFVNDGTKDNSIRILRKLIDESFSHLKDRIIIVEKENEGCPIARRTGLSYATGDYVMHADPDDWYEDGAFEVIAEAIRNYGSDVFYFDFFKEYPNRKKLKREQEYNSEQKFDYIRNMYLHKSYGNLWNKCFRRSLYLDNRIYYPLTPCAEDVCVVSQLMGYASSITHINQPLYHYMKDNPNAVTKKNPKFRRYRAVTKFLALYEFHRDTPEQECPVSCIFDDVMMRAGWSSIVYRFGFFREYPYLAENIGRISVCRSGGAGFFARCMTKIYAFFHRRFRKNLFAPVKH